MRGNIVLTPSFGSLSAAYLRLLALPAVASGVLSIPRGGAQGSEQICDERCCVSHVGRNGESHEEDLDRRCSCSAVGHLRNRSDTFVQRQYTGRRWLAVIDQSECTADASGRQWHRLAR